MTDIFDELAMQNGFEDAKEMMSLISSIDLSDKIKMQRFMTWRENDGTKDGLMKLQEKPKVVRTNSEGNDI